MSMGVRLYKNVLGVFALSGGDVVAFEPFPRDAREIAERLDGTAPEEKLILKQIKDYEIEKSRRPPDLDVLLEKAGVAREEYYGLLKEVTLVLAKGDISELRKDVLVIQAVEAQDDLEEALNILSERVREWYSLHFPELDSAVGEHMEYVELIKKYASREDFPGEFDGTLSIGARLGPDDIEILKNFASEIAHIYDFREELNSYIESAMEETAPNLLAFAGPAVGAKLISQAKGIENLAKMPASRVQVLGARRAMFKHIKNKADPPKHGVIFQHPSIKTARWWQRGKIARSFAGKAAIAAKADAFSGRYIADGLKKGFKKRLKEIRKQYPEAPKKMRIIRYKPEKKKRKGKKK
jgi:nucleolar protein 56